MNDTLDRPRTSSIHMATGVTSRAPGDVSPLNQTPVATMPELLERLEAIQTWVEGHASRRQHDGVACFNLLYQDITRRILEWIEGGRFDDAEFVTCLDLVLANRYLDALCAYEAGDPDGVPSAWEALFENRDRRGIGPLQFSVAGVNAHVNFDLPCAIVVTCELLDRQVGSGAQRADHDRIALIFGEEMRALREHFENRFERWIDEHVLVRIEDVFGHWSVDAARDTAWGNAEVLWSLRGQAIAVELVDALDRLVGLAGRGVLAHLR